MKYIKENINIIIILLFFIIYFIFIYKSYEETDKLNITIDSRINLDNPRYVDFEEINTNNPDIKKDDNSKYSQIQVQNNSDEIIRDLIIHLNEQATNKDGEFIVPAYYIYSLNPGEKAILSTQHENVVKNEPIKVAKYSYRDNSGNSVESINVNSFKNELVSENSIYEINDLDEKVKFIDLDINKNKIDNKEELKILVKNISNEKLRQIKLILKEYYNDYLVGYRVENIKNLNINESKNIIVINEENKRYELESYEVYTGNEDNLDEIKSQYSIYFKDGKYEKFDFTYDENQTEKNRIINIVTIIFVVIMFIISRMINKLKIHELKENNGVITKKHICLNILYYSLFIIYIVGIFTYL